MIQRSSITIDRSKSEEFKKFMMENAKTKEYWDNIRKDASVQVNKEELEALFNQKQ